jgi:hypothetical protein
MGMAGGNQQGISYRFPNAEQSEAGVTSPYAQRSYHLFLSKLPTRR